MTIGRTKARFGRRVSPVGFVGAYVAPVVVGLRTNYVPAGKQYMSYLAPFGADALALNPATYSGSLTVDAASYPTGARIDWTMPNGVDFPSVGGYYQWYDYGNYGGTQPAIPMTPRRVRDIDTLYDDLSWDNTGAGTFNTLCELFLSSSSTDPTIHTAEIAFILNTPASEYAFFTGGRNLGLFTDDQGVVWRCYVNGSGLDRYFAFIIATATNAATVTRKTTHLDRLGAMRWLIDHPTEPIDASHYFHGFASGIEPTDGGGTGSATLLSVTAGYTGSVKQTVTLTGASTINEGNSGTTNWIGTVTLSATSGSTVNVPWTLVLGTADAADLASGQPMSGTVSIAAGQTTGTITIGIAGDTTIEPNETFTVRITPPTGYVIGTVRQITVTINNDDVAGPPTGTQFTDQTMSTWTNQSGMTVTPNATTAPDGTTTALRITETTANSTHLANRVVASLPLAAGSRTLKIRVRRDGGTNVTQMEFSHASGNAGYIYDLGAGSAVFGYGSFAPTGSITAIGGGYYELSMTWTLGSAITGQGTLILGNQNSGYIASYAGTTAAILSAAWLTID